MVARRRGNQPSGRLHDAGRSTRPSFGITLLTPRRSSWVSTFRGRKTSVGPALRGGCWVYVPISSPSPPVLAGVLVPERRTARENARLEIGPQRGH